MWKLDLIARHSFAMFLKGWPMLPKRESKASPIKQPIRKLFEKYLAIPDFFRVSYSRITKSAFNSLTKGSQSPTGPWGLPTQLRFDF